VPRAGFWKIAEQICQPLTAKKKSSYFYFVPPRNFAFHYLLSLAKRKGWENPTLSYKMLIAGIEPATSSLPWMRSAN
jgi:hypothetical protein